MLVMVNGGRNLMEFIFLLHRVQAVEKSYPTGACGVNRMDSKSNESVKGRFSLACLVRERRIENVSGKTQHPEML